uniref:Venom protein 1 n=1 Tax=Pimpla hypochondriaca TaxID=135724 RepID=Q8MMH1_PIMHY|nr:venom protein 1 [Pimpla hypochondriaca]
MATFGYVITLVALFTLLQCQVQAEGAGFVLGENTAVFLAYQDKDRNMQYVQQELGIAKKAFDSLKRTDLNNAVDAPDSNEDTTFLSLLVMVETNGDPCPDDPHERTKFIYRHILRTAAFWNEVNAVLNKAIRNPGVQIRIVGIVLPANTDQGYSYAFSKNTHALLTWEWIPGEYLKTYNTLNEQLFGWSRATSNFFNANNFNVIATMHNFSCAGLFNFSWSMRFPNCEGKNRRPPACGLMIYDDSYALSRAVGEIAHLLGRKSVGNSAKVYSPEDITADDLADIRRNLKSMSCWKKPNENWPPGKALPPIFLKDL